MEPSWLSSMERCQSNSGILVHNSMCLGQQAVCSQVRLSQFRGSIMDTCICIHMLWDNMESPPQSGLSNPGCPFYRGSTASQLHRSSQFWKWLVFVKEHLCCAPVKPKTISTSSALTAFTALDIHSSTWLLCTWHPYKQNSVQLPRQQIIRSLAIGQ